MLYNTSMENVKKKNNISIKKVIGFLTEDIWRIRLKNLPKVKAALIRNVRIVLLAVRGFVSDKCQLRASALTFYTLLSVVPMVALAFGISQGFGMQQRLEKHILENIPAQEEVLLQVVDIAKTTLENTRGGLLAGIGIVILFWLIIKVLMNIESSFNKIWGIKKSRPISRKLTDYLSLILLCPIFIIASGSITAFVTTQIKLMAENFEFLGFFSPVIYFGLQFMPYLLIWILFIFLYSFMPNTKVKLASSVLGGIVAGSIYVITQWAYFTFQVGMAKNNAIYGSFAALPLFLVWVQISWLIVLFGAEISFAHQNVETYELEPDCHRMSLSSKRLLALHIMQYIIQLFSREEDSAKRTASAISHNLEMPIRLVRDLVNDLETAGLLTETCNDEDEEPSYTPAVEISDLTVEKCIERLEKAGENILPVKHTPSFGKLAETMEEMNRNIKRSGKNIPLKELA